MTDDDDPLVQHARARTALHVGHRSHRPLSKGSDVVGIRGEEILAKTFGGGVDTTLRPGGDGGVDKYITIWGWVRGVRREVKVAVDVKCARKPGNLIVEVGKVKPNTIYMLAQYVPGGAELLGWEWGDVLLAAPTRDFGYGVINHYIPAGRIHKMARLLRRTVMKAVQ